MIIEKEPLIPEPGFPEWDYVHCWVFDDWGKFLHGYWENRNFWNPYMPNVCYVDPPEIPDGKFPKVSTSGWEIVDEEPGPTLAEIKVIVITAATEIMDQVARDHGYGEVDSPVGLPLLAAISYRGDPNTHFAAEAEKFFDWRSRMWTYCYTEMQKIKNGTRPMPNPYTFKDELPTLEV